MTDICGIGPLPLKINHMKQLFLTLMAALGISVCSGQTLADILNTRYDNNLVPTMPVEYTLPKLVARTPFIQLFNSLLLATGQSVFHSDEYEADEYILVDIKADDRQIELYGVLFRYPHRPNRPIGWMPWQGKTIIFNGDNPGLFTPLEEARYFRYKDYPENSLYHLEDDNDPTWHFLQEQVWEHVEVKGLSGSMDCHLPFHIQTVVSQVLDRISASGSYAGALRADSEGPTDLPVRGPRKGRDDSPAENQDCDWQETQMIV
ncbi:hypothetical protein [uncultured Alistipes sp.]|uniref:hypothetical protein n=1 Tax=uncultured Alistipes sp. TaxID=538949 RepID=UPI002803FF27|nr:hypothetical protein [uncultured Alistipes sp.]